MKVSSSFGENFRNICEYLFEPSNDTSNTWRYVKNISLYNSKLSNFLIEEKKFDDETYFLILIPELEMFKGRKGTFEASNHRSFILMDACVGVYTIAVQWTTTTASFTSLFPVRTFRFIVNGSIACVVLEPVSRFITVTPQLLRNRSNYCKGLYGAFENYSLCERSITRSCRVNVKSIKRIDRLRSMRLIAWNYTIIERFFFVVASRYYRIPRIFLLLR